MEERAQSRVAFSHMAVLAAVSVVALLVVAGMQIYSAFLQQNPALIASGAGNASGVARTPSGGINWQAAPNDPFAVGSLSPEEDPDGVSNIADNVAGTLLGSYVALTEAGTYTPEDGERIALDIASSLRASVSYKEYFIADLEVDEDISYERMLEYRNDLRIALEPLLENPGYELNLFANYIESRDPAYLDQLRESVAHYRASVANTATIEVPRDATAHHVGILNALSEFGTVVERLTVFADDAFATAALLRTYNESEARLIASFDTLAKYQKSKLP